MGRTGRNVVQSHFGWTAASATLVTLLKDFHPTALTAVTAVFLPAMDKAIPLLDARRFLHGQLRRPWRIRRKN